MIRTDTKVKIITLTPSGHKVIHSFIRSFIHSFMHSFIHSFIYWLVTCNLWHLTCDIWLDILTFYLCWQWVMTMSLCYVNNFKVLHLTVEDNSGLILCKLTSLCLQLNITPSTQVISRKSPVTGHKSQVSSHRS